MKNATNCLGSIDGGFHICYSSNGHNNDHTGDESMKTLTATEAKSKFLALLRKCKELEEVFSITNNGVPCAVIMSQNVYEGLLETIEILQDPKLARDLTRAIRDADQGKTISFEKAIGRPQRR